MADEIISYGFAPGPPTKKDLEPKPEPKQLPTMVQVVQQHPNSEKIIFMLCVVIIALTIVIMLQNLKRTGAA